MSIPVHNIAYYSGDTYRLVVEFYKADGSPITLSAGEVRAFIVADAADPDGTKITEFTVAPSGSTATLSILPAQGELLTPGDTYYYDVEYSKTPTSGPVVERYTFFKGEIVVEGGITNVP